MSETIQIGRMIAAEAESVATVIRHEISAVSYYSAEARQAEFEKHSAELLQAMIQDDPDSVLIARAGVTTIGFCVSYRDDGPIWLAWFGVVANWRRRGVGRALLNALEATVHPRGCHKIWCDCRTNNLESKATLERCGYRMLCEVHNHWYGHDYFLWEKPVAFRGDVR